MTIVVMSAVADLALRSTARPSDPSAADTPPSVRRTDVEPVAPATDDGAASRPVSRRAETYYDDSAHRTVYRVTDRTTGEIVDAVPSASLLKLYAMLRAELDGRRGVSD